MEGLAAAIYSSSGAKPFHELTQSSKVSRFHRAPCMSAQLIGRQCTRIDLNASCEDVVVHAGSDTFPLAKNVRAVAARRLLDDITPLGARSAVRQPTS